MLCLIEIETENKESIETKKKKKKVTQSLKYELRWDPLPNVS